VGLGLRINKDIVPLKFVVVSSFLCGFSDFFGADCCFHAVVIHPANIHY
jgi:hypothetical protein